MKQYLSKKPIAAGVGLIVLGIICFLISVIANSGNGVLIPLGWLLIFIGSGILIVTAFLALRKEDKAVNKAIRQARAKDAEKHKK